MILGPAKAQPSQSVIRASFYADKFEGRKTASGQVFHQKALSAASRDFPLGTILRVYCPATDASIDVEVTDRGPWGKKFKLDLSKAAFEALGVSTRRGFAWVTVSKAPPVDQ